MSTHWQELATNARLDHWPLHLGVKTDPEKIQFLAAQLEEVGDMEARIEALAGELGTEQESNNRLIDEVNDLKEEILGLKDRLAAATLRIAELEARP